MNTKVNQVYRTDDYSKFHPLIGNRDIHHSTKIKKSIQENGYIFNPIIVNERYEVIDGQGRLQALSEMNIPVDYIIVPGLSRKECVVMNTVQTNWSTYDYIVSYSESGDTNYKYLRLIIDRFSKHISSYVLINIAGRIYSAGGGAAAHFVKEGAFKMDAKEYEECVSLIEWLLPVVEELKEVTQRPGQMIQAMAAVYRLGEKVNRDRLLRNVIKYKDRMIDASVLKTALDNVSLVYNIGLPAKDKQFFWEAYQRGEMK